MFFSNSYKHINCLQMQLDVVHMILFNSLVFKLELIQIIKIHIFTYCIFRMGLFSETAPFKGQKYKDIKSNCIKKGALFVDPTFPPSGKSLYFSTNTPRDIVWKRPGVGPYFICYLRSFHAE